jgi:hypothetical protein
MWVGTRLARRQVNVIACKEEYLNQIKAASLKALFPFVASFDIDADEKPKPSKERR